MEPGFERLMGCGWAEILSGSQWKEPPNPRDDVEEVKPLSGRCVQLQGVFGTFIIMIAELAIKKD